MLAPAEQRMTGPLEELRRAEIVVAVDGGPDAGEAVRTGQRLGAELGAAYPTREAVVLLLSGSANEPARAIDPAAVSGRVPLLSWSHPGQSALEATLRAAASFGAAACALVAPDIESSPGAPPNQLLAPVLDEGYDLVSPCYPTHRFDGVVNTGIVYPVIRALFGKPLRQPLGKELALSRGLATHMLGEAWAADKTHAGDRMWLMTAVLAREFRVCQVHLASPMPRVVDPSADLSASLAHVIGLLFHEMRLHAPAWQRVKASRPVKTFGDEGPPPASESRQPAIAPLVSAFQLGYQELGRLWGAVLPPQSMLALKRLAREPEPSFGIEDVLWARIVYDFAVGYHLAVMDRTLLLRSMTPLYLGWAAGFVQEVRDVEKARVGERVERLCRAFESAKPYLISRWRWPDRFNP